MNAGAKPSSHALAWIFTLCAALPLLYVLSWPVVDIVSMSPHSGLGIMPEDIDELLYPMPVTVVGKVRAQWVRTLYRPLFRARREWNRAENPLTDYWLWWHARLDDSPVLSGLPPPVSVPTP